MNDGSNEGLNNRQIQLIAVTTTCLILSTSVVVLRFYARWITAAHYWWDDWIAIVALVCSHISTSYGDSLIAKQAIASLPSIFTLDG